MYTFKWDILFFLFFWCPKKSLSIQINLSQIRYAKRSLIASNSHKNWHYKTTTKLHLFKHAIISQKCFIFSHRPRTRSNNIWPIPAERRQCCLLFSLELQNSREWIAFSFEFCVIIKTQLLIFSSHFVVLNVAKGRTKLRFLHVSHLTQSSVTAALTSFWMCMVIQVWFGWLWLTTTNRANIPQSCFSALIWLEEQDTKV